MYAAVSIDGSIAGNDFFSETLIEVNLTNASATIKTTIIGNVAEPDMDHMDFIDNVMYFYDGDPGSNSGIFLELDFSSISPTSTATILSSHSYQPIRDFVVFEDNLYFTTGNDIHYYDLSSFTTNYVGMTHTNAEYGGAIMTGIGLNYLPDNLDLGPDTTMCEGGSLSLNLSIPGASILWNTGSVGDTLEVTAPGLYWAEVTIDNCTFQSDSIQVSYVDPPIISLGEDTTLCEGAGLILSINISGASIVWSTGLVGNPLVVTEAGSYSAVVTIDGCIFLSESITVSYFDPPVINLGADTILCDGESLFLNINQPYDFLQWNNGSTSNPLEVSEPGLYWADLIIDGCTYQSDSILVLYPSTTISLGADTTLCEGESLLLTVDIPDATILWNNGSMDNPLEISEPGLYWATVNINNCAVQSDSILVSYFDPPDINLGADTILCQGESLLLNIDLPDAIVLWNNGLMNNPLEVFEPGLYWATVTLDNCAYQSDSIFISYYDPPDTNLGADTILCNGESLLLSIDIPGVTVLWNNGSTDNPLEISEPGLYWAELMVDNCLYESDSILVLYPSSQISLGADTTLCEDDSILLSIDIPGVTVLWNNGSMDNPLTITEPGWYWAELIMDNCTVQSDSIFVSYLNYQTISPGTDTTLCEGESLTLSVDLPDADVLWNTGATGDSLNVFEPGWYWATVSTDICVFQSDSVLVTYIDSLYISLGADTTLCEEESLVLNIDVPGATVIWNNGLAGNTLQVTQPGTYWANIFVGACSFLTDTITVSFVDCAPCKYFIPNVFSPNFDGFNDNFMVYFGNTCVLESIEMSIFDRWGGLRYHSKENKWDGVFKSKDSQSGVYVYLIKMLIRSYDGTIYEVIESGDVTIVK